MWKYVCTRERVKYASFLLMNEKEPPENMIFYTSKRCTLQKDALEYALSMNIDLAN